MFCSLNVFGNYKLHFKIKSDLLIMTLDGPLLLATNQLCTNIYSCL